jgi:hypothetical protein
MCPGVSRCFVLTRETGDRTGDEMARDGAKTGMASHPIRCNVASALFAGYAICLSVRRSGTRRQKIWPLSVPTEQNGGCPNTTDTGRLPTHFRMPTTSPSGIAQSRSKQLPSWLSGTPRKRKRKSRRLGSHARSFASFQPSIRLVVDRSVFTKTWERRRLVSQS